MKSIMISCNESYTFDEFTVSELNEHVSTGLIVATTVCYSFYRNISVSITMTNHRNKNVDLVEQFMSPFPEITADGGNLFSFFFYEMESTISSATYYGELRRVLFL